eukprot:TRINITY_DN4849_c0_g1_i1.p1 TRINITY_DN4849_c0_g1~~TRINITY_DN4849_c0_g1_i1.p1  ORF type:complete len:353 (+),score=108.60 TRINITY_DN4849_c0_g1_i1:45-1103(+)
MIEKEIKKIMKEREVGIEIEIDEVEDGKATLILDNRYCFYLTFPEDFEVDRKLQENENFEFSTKEISKKFKEYIDSLNKYLKQKKVRGIDVSLKEILLYASTSYQNFLSHEDSQDSLGTEESDERSSKDFFDGEDESSTGESNEISIDTYNQVIENKNTMEKLQVGELPNISTISATKRILSDWGEVKDRKMEIDGFEAKPTKNLYKWEVKMLPPEDSDLLKDFVNLQNTVGKEVVDSLKFECYFSSTYPHSPPFIRLISPRFLQSTGHVTLHGSICIDLLTLSGWLPSNSLESVMIQIRSCLIDGNCRIDLVNHNKPYPLKKAIDSFKHTAKGHQWTVPNLDDYSLFDDVK